MTFQTQFHFGTERFSYAEAAMGTVFVFQGTSPLNAADTRTACELAMAIIHEADTTFSLYKPESPLSRLARGETSVAACPPVVSQIWDDCENWEKITDGWFSAFTPEHTFDPSGLVKTWAARAAAQFLESRGIVDLSMNAGGDIWIADGASKDQDWRVAVSKPVSIASADAGLLTVLDLRDTNFRAVCTSGSAERGQHIWNPKAPGRESASELVQVTVVAHDLVQADVWATAAFAHGSRSVKQLNDYNLANPADQVQALLVFPDGQLAGTDGFEAILARSA
jgi:thiamine biosynthesis lipoprotein